MRLSRPVKLLIGALTLWPFAYMLLFFGFIFSSFFSMNSRSGSAPGMPPAFVVLFAAHLLTMLLMFGLITFYVVYLFKTQRIAQDKKALWAVVLFLGNMLAMPVFFWLYVWPEDRSME